MSHGITGSSTDKGEDVERSEHHDIGTDTSGQGLGFGVGGLGFAPAQGAEDVPDEVDIADLPSSFGQRLSLDSLAVSPPRDQVKMHIQCCCQCENETPLVF